MKGAIEMGFIKFKNQIYFKALLLVPSYYSQGFVDVRD